LHAVTVALPAARLVPVTVRLAANAVTPPNTTTPTAIGTRNFFTVVS